ncbi:MAG: hypothetical protein HFJ80_00060 [Clostridiales bacterium]|nr:hypothetical protein [Clostridiales bacterium]
MSPTESPSAKPPAIGKASVDTLGVVLCLGAAASSSVTAALVVTAAGAAVLLLTLLLLTLLRMKAGAVRSAAALLFSLALSASVRLWLDAAQPEWMPDDFSRGLLEAALLFCGPAAIRLLDRPLETGTGRMLLYALAMPVTGAVRELLSAGSLMGVRLLPEGLPLSRSFAGGAAGLMTAGLLLALFRIRLRGMVRLTPRDGLRAGLAVALTALPAVLLYLLLVRFLPLAETIRLLLAPVCAVLFAGLLSRLWPEGRLKPLFRAEWVAALAVLFLSGAAAAGERAGHGPAFLGAALAALALGMAVSLAASLFGRMENIHLPSALRSAPAALTAAGLALLAFQVIRL